jgi:ABC-type thiamine transport system ATPase subunit
VTLVREPTVFLMDEPFSNLDAKLRVQMRTEVLRIDRPANLFVASFMGSPRTSSPLKTGAALTHEAA